MYVNIRTLDAIYDSRCYNKRYRRELALLAQRSDEIAAFEILNKQFAKSSFERGESRFMFTIIGRKNRRPLWCAKIGAGDFLLLSGDVL